MPSASCVQYKVVCDAYGGPGATLATLSKPQPVHDHGSLPFTGLDIGLVVAGAALLIALGVLLRRAAHVR